MNFEEQFPSLKDLSFKDAWSTPYENYVHITDIQKHCLDKARVKETLYKFLSGNKNVRHEDCDRPYGDDCGYCEFCKQRQHELIERIFNELGLEDEE